MTYFPVPIFCAIDTINFDRVLSLTNAIAGTVAGVKLGIEFFCAHGAYGVHTVQRRNNSIPVFLDFKFHDIPKVVAGAVRGIVSLRPFMIDIHASGGRTMMQVAAATCAEEADKIGASRPLLVAVTVLTSLDDTDMADISVSSDSVADQVLRLANLAQVCGLDGVVCSAYDVQRLRTCCGPDFKLVVPGVRPSWARHDDQKRVLTPVEALDAGADILVIGRPLTEALDPTTAIRQVIREINYARTISCL